MIDMVVQKKRKAQEEQPEAQSRETYMSHGHKRFRDICYVGSGVPGRKT